MLNETKPFQKRIVCAANRSECGLIVLGVRHLDMQMRNHILSIRTSLNLPNLKFREQGFIDNQGNFCTREEAWLIAEKANQIYRRVGGDMSIDNVGKLFTENLY